jgi:hypothetical protein
MPKFLRTFIPVIFILIIRPVGIKSQVTISPYSIFGLGYLESNSTGPSKAMGGTGLAFLSGRSINFMNPASYSGIDSLMSIFELGVFGKYTTYSLDSYDQSLANANLRYLAMGFRITPWLATSFGFSPYSSVGYDINAKSPIEGTNLEYPKSFSGGGGVNQVYLGGSVSLIKNLSLGFNAAFLFGSITHKESSNEFYYNLVDETYVSSFNINYGLNYQLDIKEWNYSLGLTYNRSKKLFTKNVTTIETDYYKEVLKERNYRYSIPQNIGAGVAISKGYFVAGFDYEWSNWKDVKFSEAYLKTRNSNRYSFGVEIPSLGIRKGSGRMFLFRFGAEYRESYMVIEKVPIDYRALTFGTGIPLKGIVSVINASIELGQNGTTKKDLFRENFIMLNLDLSLRDLWFMKRRYN